jgi:uncharacterized spore protein YtfJ
MKKCLVFMVWVLILMSFVAITIQAIAQEDPATAAVDTSIQTALEELKRVYATEITLGKPMEVNGLKLIPLATVGIGYGQHGMQPEKEKMRGVGGVLIPVGIVVVSGRDVRIIQLSKGFIEQLIDALAPVMLQVMNLKQKEGREAEGVAQGKGISVKEREIKTGKTFTSIYMRVVGFFLLGWLVMVLIIEAFLPQRVTTVVAILRQNYLLTGLVGLIGYGVMFLLIVLFTISLIGIPLTFVVIILTCALTLFGTTGIALMVGQRILEALKQTGYSNMLCILIGGFMMGIIGIIPIIGWIAWTIVGVLGFGTVLRGMLVSPAK